MLTIFTSLFIGALNALRGSGLAKGEAITKFLFSKYVIVGYFFLLVFLVTKSHILAGLFIAPILFQYLTGTGGLMQAFTNDKIDAKEFKPFDFLADVIVRKPILTLEKARKWGVWYGTFTGIVFYFPFITFGDYLQGLPMLGLGLYCGALRYFKNSNGWRFIEFSYYLMYSLLFLN